MDDLFDFFLELFLEVFSWESLNRDLRKKIPNRPLRWLVATLIYLLFFAALVAILAGIFLLISKLV